MINNLSAYSFANNDVLTLYGLASGTLTPGTLDPQTEQTRDGGYLPPPVSVVYTPREINGEDSLVFDNYLCEGSSVSVNLSTTSTCVNLATGYDLFNFGYELLIEEKGQVLDRVDTFNYNNTFNIVCSASLISNWEILSGTATYNKEATALSGTGIDLLPVGTYINTDWPYDTLTVKYYLPIEESAPIFWPNELLNVYKTKKIVWDMFSTRLGGEELKGDYIPFKRNETAYIVDQPRAIPLSEIEDLSLFINLPMTDSPTIPPTNESIFGETPLVFYDPEIQSTVTRPGYQYAGYFPGDRDGAQSGSNGMFYYNTDSWNYLNNDFIVDTWVYLPSDKVTQYTFNWFGGPVTILDNAICGHGGPDTGGNVISVWHPLNELSSTRLRLYNINGDYIESNTLFPLDQWVNVVVIHNSKTLLTRLFINDELVAEELISLEKSPITGPKFFIGGRDDNSAGGFNWSWRGYISNFKLYASNYPDYRYIPTEPTSILYSLSTEFATNYKSKILWSDGFITENNFTYPLYLPDDTYGSAGGVINSRKFTQPGEYTILDNTFYYKNLSGSEDFIVEPYNITFVVS
jgi:hypothetical protein